ncbi:MAG TPA: YraN family protein [Synergistales bacterium]|nr:YraN family protein [Synergistales bacterium]
MARHIELGAAGEALAARELSRLGYRLVDANVRMKMGELDIVAEEDGEMVVVEVRTRTIGRMLPPEATVGPSKIRKLVRTGRAYMDRIGWEGPWRIDIAAITVGPDGKPALEIFRDITVGIIEP